MQRNYIALCLLSVCVVAKPRYNEIVYNKLLVIMKYMNSLAFNTVNSVHLQRIFQLMKLL